MVSVTWHPDCGCEASSQRDCYCQVCTDCGDVLRASWSGRCLRCHEARLLPPESWADEYLGVAE